MKKNFTLLTIFAAISLFFWLFVKLWLNSPSLFEDPGLLVFSFVFLVLIAVSLTSAFILVIPRIWKFLFTLTVFLTFLIIFGYDNIYFAAFGIAFLFQFAATKRFENELNNRTLVDIKMVSRRGTPLLITSFLILVSFAYFLTPNVQMTAQERELPRSIQKVVQTVINSYLGEQTDIGPEMKEEAEIEIIKTIDGYLSPYYRFFPPIFAFGLFLILQSISFIFLWPAIGLSVVLFWFLKRVGIIKITKTQKEVEKIEF